MTATAPASTRQPCRLRALAFDNALPRGWPMAVAER